MNIVTIPAPVDNGRFFESDVNFLYENFRKHIDLIEKGERPLSAIADRYACGFPLPPFQRDLKWTREQEIRFIESIFLKITIGSYIINEFDCDNNGVDTEYSGWLIDGQQRLTSLERYFRNEFPVFGGFFSDLTPPQRRRFLSTKFTHYEAKLHDYNKLKALYVLMAFGGVPHTEEDRV